MKFIHLSDLHLGKRVNEFSMLEDQNYILKEIIEIIDSEKPDAILIAGDVYDKSIAPTEAIQLFDEFLVSLSKRKLEVFIISGNHDSPERLSFGNRLMDLSGIHVAPVYNGSLIPFTFEDKYGPVHIFLLPFVKPAHVKRFSDQEIVSYTDALQAVISKLDLSSTNRNILVTHQFVTGASRTESEEISVGGTDNVDASIFDAFDYVALGHLHRPQNCTSERIRYCGTPLKYSFSESKDQKSVTVVELNEKENLSVKTVPLKPLHDLCEIKGTYEELTLKSFYENTTYPNDYMHITLTDEEDVMGAIGKLRVIYPYLMKLDYDNKRTRTNTVINQTNEIEHQSPLELFSNFFSLQNNQSMTEKQKEYMESLIENIWEDNL